MITGGEPLLQNDIADIDDYIKNNLVNGKIDGRIKDNTKHSPNIEFEIKTKFLVKSLYTKKAKEICEERTQFVKDFLDRLEREVKGEL